MTIGDADPEQEHEDQHVTMISSEGFWIVNADHWHALVDVGIRFEYNVYPVLDIQETARTHTIIRSWLRCDVEGFANLTGDDADELLPTTTKNLTDALLNLVSREARAAAR